MDEARMKKAFPEFMERREQKLCPFCGKPINEADFRDDTSRREYRISGLCQSCQDETFGTQTDAEGEQACFDREES